MMTKYLLSTLLVLGLGAAPALAANQLPEPEPTINAYKSGMTLEEARALRAQRQEQEKRAQVETLRERVRQNPESAEAYKELVEALVAVGDVDEAIDACKDCLQTHPYYAALRLRLAELYDRTDRDHLALCEYRMIVLDFPAWIQARIQFAIFLEKLDMRVEANEQWKAVQEQSDKIQILETASRHIAENG